MNIELRTLHSDIGLWTLDIGLWTVKTDLNY
jgi:hypothetical protein